MSFQRGASLSTATSLGYADSADVGPTAGNGFYRRWPDDLAALQHAGVTDLRLTLDWARLQPKPSVLDDDWAERFEQMCRAAGAIDLRIWATLHDGSIPKWFDNEGGFDDDTAFTTWWPRWVERAAERFGDVVTAWVPFAEIPAGAPAQPWRDTWGILNGPHPVIASVDPSSADIDSYVGHMTHLGIALATTWERDGDVGERELEASMTTWGNLIRDSTEAASRTPIVISGFCPGHDDAATSASIVQQLTSSLDDAIDDGVDVTVCFLEPAISTSDSPLGLLDADRAPTRAAELFLP